MTIISDETGSVWTQQIDFLIGSLRQFCDSQKEGEKYVFLRRPAPFFTKVVDWGISK